MSALEFVAAPHPDPLPVKDGEREASRSRQDDEVIAECVGGVGVGRKMPGKVLADRGYGAHEAIPRLTFAD
jgi:hypothetical protein